MGHVHNDSLRPKLPPATQTAAAPRTRIRAFPPRQIEKDFKMRRALAFALLLGSEFCYQLIVCPLVSASLAE